MISIRTIVVSLLSLAAAMFVLPAAAQSPTKQFSLSFNPGTVTTAATTSLNVRITNETPNGNSTMNSIRIGLPSGYRVGGTVAFVTAWLGNIDGPLGASEVKITNMSPIKPGKFVVLSLPVTVTSAIACTPDNWSNSVAWTGSSLSGDSFAKIAPRDLSGGYRITTSIGSPYQLAFDPQPSSVAFPIGGALATLAPFGVKFTRACGLDATLPVTVTTSLVAQNVGSKGVLAGPTSQSTTLSAGSGSTAIAFSGLTVSGTGTYKIVASTTIGDITTTAESSAFSIYAGTLACAAAGTTPGPGESGFFSASLPNATDVPDTGFAEGFRGLNKNGGCVPDLLNYTFVNNIDGANAITDPAGNTVPINGVSLIWDRTAHQNVTFRYSVTWSPEWVAEGTGLPSRTTKLCLPTDSACINPVNVKACLGTALEAASLPYVTGNSGPKMPACIVAEVWGTVLPGDPDCDLPDSSGPRACVKVNTTIIDIGDPVMIRD